MRQVFDRIELLARCAALHLFIATMFAACLLLLPTVLIGPRWWVKNGADTFIRNALWALKHICGMTYEVRGWHNVPAGPVLFASKHFSQWEAVVLPTLLGDPAAVLRREILFVPLYGQVILRLKHIVIARSGGAAEAVSMLRQAMSRVAEGRSILIFPEGTRTNPVPFPPPDYKLGVVAMYRKLGIPCVPIALNSGLFWPRKSLMRYPGKIIVDILPAIPPGSGSREFLTTLTHQIETASQHLVDQSLASRAD